MNGHVEFREIQFPVDGTVPRRKPRAPRFGAVSPSIRCPARVTRPRSEIIAGFETQELRLRANGRLLAFQRSVVGGPFPFIHPVIVASTSVHSYDELCAQVVPAAEAALSVDRQWVDRMLVLPDTAAALGVAAQLGGRFAMRWTELGVAILDLASGEEVSHFAMYPSSDPAFFEQPRAYVKAPGEGFRLG